MKIMDFIMKFFQRYWKLEQMLDFVDFTITRLFAKIRLSIINIAFELEFISLYF